MAGPRIPREGTELAEMRDNMIRAGTLPEAQLPTPREGTALAEMRDNMARAGTLPGTEKGWADREADRASGRGQTSGGPAR